jgi:hypothetical protein
MALIVVRVGSADKDLPCAFLTASREFPGLAFGAAAYSRTALTGSDVQFNALMAATIGNGRASVHNVSSRGTLVRTIPGVAAMRTVTGPSWPARPVGRH